jgi:hypothetical protein
MSRSLVWIATLLALGLSVSTQALACQGTAMLFDDKFEAIDPAWQNLATNNGKIENKHLLIALSPLENPANSTATASMNQRDIYTDIIACVDFSIDTQTPDSRVGDFVFGIIFWGADSSSYTVLAITQKGSYAVLRNASNRWLYPIPWTESALVKKEAGQQQELEIHTKQNSAELFINGTKVGDIKGTMPSGGGTVGIFYQVPGTGGKISVTRFQVKN